MVEYSHRNNNNMNLLIPQYQLYTRPFVLAVIFLTFDVLYLMDSVNFRREAATAPVLRNVWKLKEFIMVLNLTSTYRSQ